MRTNKSETVVVPPEFHSNTEYGAQQVAIVCKSLMWLCDSTSVLVICSYHNADALFYF